MKYYYVRRIIKKDGVLQDLGVVDIPEKNLHDTLRNNPDWIIDSEVGVGVPEKVVEPVPDKFECPICGREFTSERGLKVHKATHL